MADRIHRTAGAITATILVLAASTARAQQTPSEFKAISSLDPGAQAGTVLMKAVVANPKDWPASFFSTHEGGACTSTLIGPRVLLTAAHCMPNGGTARITMGQTAVIATCTHSPGYKRNGTSLQRSEDYALCLLEQEVKGIAFENVNTNTALVVDGNALLLTGFGCVKPPPAPSDGLYRIGEATVIELPSKLSNDIVTHGEVALCFGDSGGPAMAFLDPSKKQRVQVSVNSRGNILDTSYLSSLTAPAAVKFLADWSAKHAVYICGVHAQANGCRP